MHATWKLSWKILILNIFDTWFHNPLSIIIENKSLSFCCHLLLGVRSIVLPELNCTEGSKPSAVAKAKWCLNSGDAACCILKKIWSHFPPWENSRRTMRLPRSLLLSLKLHRFEQQCTSLAQFDCTGLLAPSLHQPSCSLSKGRRKTRTKATLF